MVFEILRLRYLVRFVWNNKAKHKQWLNKIPFLLTSKITCYSVTTDSPVYAEAYICVKNVQYIALNQYKWSLRRLKKISCSFKAQQNLCIAYIL